MTDFAVKTGTPVAAPVLVPTLQLTPAELGALGRVVAAAQAGVPAAAEDVLLVGPTLRGMGMYADKLVAARASGQAVGTGYANPTLYVSPAHAGRLAHLFQRVALNQTVSDEHRRSAEQVGPALQQLVELNPGSGAGQVLGPMAGALEGQDVRKGLLPAAAQLAAWMQEALPVSQARTVLDRAQLDALADVLTNSFSIQRAPVMAAAQQAVTQLQNSPLGSQPDVKAVAEFLALAASKGPEKVPSGIWLRAAAALQNWQNP